MIAWSRMVPDPLLAAAVALKPSMIAERTPPGTVLCAASKKNFGNAPTPLMLAVNGVLPKTGSLTVTVIWFGNGDWAAVTPLVQPS